MPLCQNKSWQVQNHLYENMFVFMLSVNQTHFLTKGFAQGLIVKQRHKAPENGLLGVYTMSSYSAQVLINVFLGLSIL